MRTAPLFPPLYCVINIAEVRCASSTFRPSAASDRQKGVGTKGRYWFNAVRPKFYPIPDDGPVGKMLAHMGRHPFRPAHLHYIIEADGFETLTTHTFDPDDPYIHSDAVFGVKESLIAQYKDTTPDSSYQKQWEVEFDFVLAKG